MSRILLRCAVPVIVAAGLAVVTASAVQAQVPSASANGFQPPVKTADPAPPKLPLPPALPGTANRAEPAPERQVLDLPPTESLFDAINRGDVASARDAINRGADMSGLNVLGMTPLDLSVDLGRNDITFLLLSLRGGNASAGPAPVAPAVEARKPRQAAGAARKFRQPIAVSATPERGNRRYADAPSRDGGTPVPQAGFLGFGAVQ